MKTTATFAALMLASPAASNSVPFSMTTPGWKMGTTGAPIQMNVFYDLLCPDSWNAYLLWKKIFEQESHVSGKKYSELIDMTVSSLVLPYHGHSWVVSKAIPYLQDICAEDESKCFLQAYHELAWPYWNKDLMDTSISTDDFIKKWAGMVHDSIPEIDPEYFQSLYGPSDKHNSESRARAIWKYGASRGISATPQIYINGVMLDDYPMEEAQWKQLLQEIYPAKSST